MWTETPGDPRELGKVNARPGHGVREIMSRVSSHYKILPTIEQSFFPSCDFTGLHFIVTTARKKS